MAELVAVRHKSQQDTEEPGLMSKDYYERFGKDKGYVEVTDEAAQAAAAAASGEPPPAKEPAPSTRKGRG